MRETLRSLQLFSVMMSALVTSALALSTGAVDASCLLEAASEEDAGPLVKHLAADCTPAERESHAIAGQIIMAALAKGRSVDLAGVIVRGDLSFDELAPQAMQLPKGLSPEQQAALAQLNADELRLVSAPVAIRDSIVWGAVRHRSAKGTLQFKGPVNFHGTTFREGVDLSRSVFQDTFDVSGAKFEKEAYFVHGQFSHRLNCKEARFGPHTRFHKSVFRGPVTCAAAVFDGMAEFLEVTFEQAVTMEGVRFGSGTGFSGSHFKRHVNFSDAIFSREAFFGFVRFGADVSFAGAQFLTSADFTDAAFQGQGDLMKARFDQKPVLVRTTGLTRDEKTGWLQSPAGQYAVTLFFLLMAALLVAYAVKIK